MIRKLRFIEAGAVNRYRKTWKNRFVYNSNICNPSTGLITLTTIAKRLIDDTLMYSESISIIDWEDIVDADIVFISINTFNATRGYEIADRLRGMRSSNKLSDPSLLSHLQASHETKASLESRLEAEHNDTELSTESSIVSAKHRCPLVVLGGMHATLNFSEAVQHADYVLLGDGDESIVEFIQVLQDADEIKLPQHPELAWQQDDMPIQIPGLAFLRMSPEGEAQVITTKERHQPLSIDTIPDRSLVYDYARMAKKYDTLWPQVHASRGCTGTCDYCCVIAHFGRTMRTRTPKVVVEDIKQAIAFHDRSVPPRLSRVVWLTDDNFALDREWAKDVLHAIIASDITWKISVQARWELGFDDEILALMKQANFFEVSLGIEFIDDASFKRYHKACTRKKVEQAIANIQSHGIGVRGLFILGSDEDTLGVGDRLGQFVIDNNIHGCLVQSMFFVPGTPVYEQSKDRLLHTYWEHFNGSVVHRPRNMSPAELQQEIINASRKAYSLRRLLHSLLHGKGILKVLALGETLWHAHMRTVWRKQIPALQSYDAPREQSNCQENYVDRDTPLVLQST